MTVINTSINTALSTEDEKYPIIFTIQTEEIKQYKKISTLKQNIIKLYGLI